MEGVRAAIMEELEQWEKRYLDVQAELDTVRLEFTRISTETKEQSTVSDTAQVALRERVAQLEAMLLERDKALASGQHELVQVRGEQGQWEVRYRQADEEMRALRLELSRAVSQSQEQTATLAALQNERSALQSRIAELERTVVQREVSVESVEAELKRAMEMQETVLSERMQWEGRYREAMEDVQVQLSRLQASADARAQITQTTTKVTRIVEDAEVIEEHGEGASDNGQS